MSSPLVQTKTYGLISNRIITQYTYGVIWYRCAFCDQLTDTDLCSVCMRSGSYQNSIMGNKI